MILYEPLWQTMEKQQVSTYTLQMKGNISSSTIRRLKSNQSVSTNTLDSLCKLLNCTLDEVVLYVPEEIK